MNKRCENCEAKNIVWNDRYFWYTITILLATLVATGCYPTPRDQWDIASYREKPHDTDFDINAEPRGWAQDEDGIGCGSCEMSGSRKKVFLYKGKEVAQCTWCWHLTTLDRMRKMEPNMYLTDDGHEATKEQWQQMMETKNRDLRQKRE